MHIVHFERNVLTHVPASSISEVAEDLSSIVKVRRPKTAEALAEKLVSPLAMALSHWWGSDL